MTLQEKLEYVDKVFAFLFNGSFAVKFNEVDASGETSPLFDPQFWYVNARVFAALAAARPPSEAQRMPLFTLIETLHFHATTPFHEGGEPDFDVSHHDYPDDILSYRQDAIDCLMRERSRPG